MGECLRGVRRDQWEKPREIRVRMTATNRGCHRYRLGRECWPPREEERSPGSGEEPTR